jgi:L-serine dehydratase
VVNLLGYAVDFDGESTTLIIPHQDRPGTIAAVTALLAEEGINIARMRVSREVPGADAIMIIETDEICDQRGVEKIQKIPSVFAVTLVRPL